MNRHTPCPLSLRLPRRFHLRLSLTGPFVGNPDHRPSPPNALTELSWTLLAIRASLLTEPDPDGAGPLSAPTTSYTYDSVGDMVGMTTLDGTTSYEYDNLGRATKVTMPDPDGAGSGVSPWTVYTYDANGQKLTETDRLGHETSYTYDNLGRLIATTDAESGETDYTYDANGNRTNTGYTTGDNNQLTSDGTFNYTYDDEGNRLTRTNISTSELTEYTWDYRNRLTSIVTKDSGGTVTKEVDYTYDIFNRRIVKTIDADGAGSGTATEQVYIYDGLRDERGAAGDHMLLRFDESDALTDRYFYGPNVDQILASEAVTSTSSAGDVLWALTDNLGTVRDVASYDSGTDTTTVENHLTYNSFGKITAETASAVDFLFGFTGRERDEESDLQYNRARYFDSEVGKWISEDPLEFDAGDGNLTRYVTNAPLVATDSSGLLPRYIACDSVVIASKAIAIPNVLNGTLTVSTVGRLLDSNYPNKLMEDEVEISFQATKFDCKDLHFVQFKHHTLDYRYYT